MIFGFQWQKMLLRIVLKKALFIKEETFDDLLPEYFFSYVFKIA